MIIGLFTVGALPYQINVHLWKGRRELPRGLPSCLSTCTTGLVVSLLLPRTQTVRRYLYLVVHICAFWKRFATGG